jgi:hypothetical protein
VSTDASVPSDRWHGSWEVTSTNSRSRQMMPPTMTIEDPTAAEALARARDDINEARKAFMRADGHRQALYARSVIDSAATILVNPAATRREVVAAHSFLREALALDGRPNTCGAENIDTLGEASALSPDDQKWLQNYLASRGPTMQQSMVRVPDRRSHFLNSVHLPTSLSQLVLNQTRANLRGERS